MHCRASGGIAERRWLRRQLPHGRGRASGGGFDGGCSIGERSRRRHNPSDEHAKWAPTLRKEKEDGATAVGGGENGVGAVSENPAVNVGSEMKQVTCLLETIRQRAKGVWLRREDFPWLVVFVAMEKAAADGKNYFHAGQAPWMRQRKHPR